MMAKITAETGNEVALLRLTNGRRVLRMGGPDYVYIGRGVKTIIAHTHPRGALWLSKADVDTLTVLGQRSTVIILPRHAFGLRLMTSGSRYYGKLETNR